MWMPRCKSVLTENILLSWFLNQKIELKSSHTFEFRCLRKVGLSIPLNVQKVDGEVVMKAWLYVDDKMISCIEVKKNHIKHFMVKRFGNNY